MLYENEWDERKSWANPNQQYLDAVEEQPGVTILDEGTKNGVKYLFFEYEEAGEKTEYNYVMKIEKSKTGEPFFVNCYPRVVTAEGNPQGVKIIEEYMEPCDSVWRGLGNIPKSGLTLREKYQAYDARKKHDVPHIEGRSNPGCRCGDVLQGKCKPSDCKLFGKACNPRHPVGACMVSGEGACSAYYQYGGVELL